MVELLRDCLAVVGLLAIGVGTAACIRSYLDAKLPGNLPPPRRDERDKQREWDRIQGR